MYGDQFCKVYNEFGWNYFPEAFAQQLLKWLKVHDIRICTALDLGCGTGILCRELSSAGIRTLGTDISEDMIRIARNNFPELDFEVRDMVTYVPETEYDLVTCTGDALNHVLRMEQVAAVFRNVYNALKPGGYFIFDILSGREVGNGEPIDLEYDEHTSAIFRICREDAGIVQLNIAVSENGNQTFEETITEILYDPEQIHDLLLHSGFDDIIRTDRLLEDAEAQSTSWYFIARRRSEERK